MPLRFHFDSAYLRYSCRKFGHELALVHVRIEVITRFGLLSRALYRSSESHLSYPKVSSARVVHLGERILLHRAIDVDFDRVTVVAGVMIPCFNRLKVIGPLLIALVLAPAAECSVTGRKTLSMVWGWRFHFGDIPATDFRANRDEAQGGGKAASAWGAAGPAESPGTGDSLTSLYLTREKALQ